MNPFGFLEEPLADFLRFLNEQATFTVGWAIVVLTVCVRVVLLPLFVSQYRSARRMQQISPQLKQVQARYKNDKRKQQEEMMKLFQDHKVNPFGSCLPIVFQAPVFISLFFVLRNFANQEIVGDRGFMWIFPDISQQFRDLGWHAAVVALIYGLSQLLATEVSMATTPQTNEWQRKLFRVLPLFIVGGLFLYPNVPAGLVLYWMTTNLWTCGQQVVLKRRLGPLQLVTADVGGAEPEPEPAPKPKAKPRPPKPSAAAATGDGQAGGAATRDSGTKKPRPKGGSGQGSQRRRPPKKR
jgi:YidC/Oxa1 family membrane protein insertase